MESFESQFTSEHFEALGKINVYFQSIENQLDYLLAALLNTKILSPQMTRLNSLLCGVSFKVKLSTLRSMINNIKGFDDISDIFHTDIHNKSELLLEELYSLKPLFPEIEKCSHIRNKYAHSHWIDGGICGPEETVARTKITAKGKMTKGELVFEHSDDLKEKADFIYSISSQLLSKAMRIQSLSSVGYDVLNK